MVSVHSIPGRTIEIVALHHILSVIATSQSGGGSSYHQDTALRLTLAAADFVRTSTKSAFRKSRECRSGQNPHWQVREIDVSLG